MIEPSSYSAIRAALPPKSVEPGKRCLFANCKNRPEKSHSIQNFFLKKVAGNPGNQLYTFLDEMTSIKFLNELSHSSNINNTICRKTTNLCSVFSGFCSLHEHQEYSDMENYGFDHSIKQSFFLSYRTLCHQLSWYENQLSHLSNLKDARSKIFNLPVFHIEYLKRNTIQDDTDKHYHSVTNKKIKIIKKLKKDFEAVMSTAKYKKYHFFNIEFNGILPLVLQGIAILKINSRHESVLIGSTTWTTDKSGQPVTILSFAWSKKDIAMTGAILRQRKVSNKLKQLLVVPFAFYYFIHIYFNSNWWEKLSTNQQRSLHMNFMSNFERFDGIRFNKHDNFNNNYVISSETLL